MVEIIVNLLWKYFFCKTLWLNLLKIFFLRKKVNKRIKLTFTFKDRDKHEPDEDNFVKK